MKNLFGVRIRKTTTTLLCVLLTAGLLPCSAGQASAASLPMNGRGTRLSVGSDGSTVIRRNAIKNGKATGKAGTWMVYVYLCGSNLESDYSEASDLIDAMVAGSAGSPVGYLIETGGSTDWNYKGVSAGSNYYLYIKGGKSKIVGKTAKADMGKESTLTSFLQYAQKNYPAEKTGLIFWDHGGGSISGVCFDEQFDDDSLTLKDIDRSLCAAAEGRTRKYDFIGFDACLMGSVEAADILVPYADYMIGSEETQYGSWDYADFGAYLAKHPKAGGKDAATELVKGYKDGLNTLAQMQESGDLVSENEDSGDNGDDDSSEQSNDYVYMAANEALDVVDLSKIDAVIRALDTACDGISDWLDDPDLTGAVADSLSAADNFGGNSPGEGYTNMIDLRSFFTGLCDYCEAEEYAPYLYDAVEGKNGLQQALKDAVVYKATGDLHSDAGGLSIYYPLELQDTTEMGIFKDIAVSCRYYDVVNRMLYGKCNGDLEGYDDHSEMQAFWSGKKYTHPTWDPANQHSNSRVKIKKISASGGQITLDYEPDSMDYIADAEMCIVQNEDDNDELGILLGFDGNVSTDSDNCCSEGVFDGSWTSLPNYSLLTRFVQDYGTDGEIMYSSPIQLNGQKTNLMYTWDPDTEEYSVEGTWDGIDESGAASRSVVPVVKGDKIVPLYPEVVLKDHDLEKYLDNTDYREDTSTAGKNFNVSACSLPDGHYEIGFRITDIYGGYVYSDRVGVTLEE